MRRSLLPAAMLSALVPAGDAGASAHDPARHDLSAFVGRWQIDLARTRMERFGPTGRNMVRAPTFTFVFKPVRDSLSISVYEHYPMSSPTRTMSIIPDGRRHRCEDKAACMTAGGDAAEQSYVYRQFAPRMLIRSFYTSGVLTEVSTYGVSADGQTFTMIAWSAQTPQYQNVQVFTRQA